MNINEAKEKYKGEWIAFKYSNENGNANGEVILHGKERWKFDKTLIENNITNVYITFAGPLVKEGFSVMFLIK